MNPNVLMLIFGLGLAFISGILSWGSLIDYMLCGEKPCLSLFDFGATPRFMGVLFGFIGFFISIAFWVGYFIDRDFWKEEFLQRERSPSELQNRQSVSERRE